MAREQGLTAVVPESFYEKPFIRRMLDPSSPTIEIDGKEASVRTTSMDGRLFPTVVPQEQADGSYALVELKPRAAHDLAIKTGNFIQFDSDEEADRASNILSDEASALRQAYKNNQNFLAQGGKGLGDVEFRADVEPYVKDDALTRLGLELYRRGEIELKGITKDQNKRIAVGENSLLGGYAGQGSRLRGLLEKDIRDQNPLTKEKIMSSPSLATYIAGVSEKSDTTYDRPRGESELAAMHELRHGALEYLFNTTDLNKQKYFDNYDIDVEEDIMDMIDNKVIKDQQMSMEVDKVSKTNPKYIGRKDRLKTITEYATNALEDFDVPKRTEQTQPSMLNRLLGKEQGGIMMAQQGQAVLPVTEATSAPQGGGPKGANPAARPPLVSTPQQAPRPGSTDPRDAAIQEVSQKMQTKTAPPPAQPMPMAPVGGLAAPQQPIMMAKGGTAEEKPEGLAVMIGLGAPTPSYEEAAEGNPPPGATKEEVADDQLVLLSEGELVVPANVVRYHGLGAYEGMRREALMGLQDMEQSGQIEYVSGGKEKADKIDDDGGIVKAQTGTYLMNSPQFPAQTFVPQYKPFGLQTPVAASAKFVQNPLGQQQPFAGTTSLGLPTTQTTTSLTNPLLLPTVPSSITGVYAPNIGSYRTFQDDGTGGTTSPTNLPLFDPTKTAIASGATSAQGGGDSAEGREDKADVTQQPNAPIGNHKYTYSTESSKPAPLPGLAGAAINIFSQDQVRLTDPFNINEFSGKNRSAVMSKETYEELKNNPNRAEVDAFMEDLFAAQQAVDFNRDRALRTDLAANPITGVARQIGVGLGLADPYGMTKDQQQAAAKALATDMGVAYTGQSLAEMMVAGQDYKPDALPPVTNRLGFTLDAAGNRVPITETSQPYTDPFMALGGDIKSPVTPPAVAAPTTMATPRSLSSFGISPEERALAAPVSPSGTTYASPEALERAGQEAYDAFTALLTDPSSKNAFSANDLARIAAGEATVTSSGIAYSQPIGGGRVGPADLVYQKSSNAYIASQEQQAAADALNNMDLPTAFSPLTSAELFRQEERKRAAMQGLAAPKVTGAPIVTPLTPADLFRQDQLNRRSRALRDDYYSLGGEQADPVTPEALSPDATASYLNEVAELAAPVSPSGTTYASPEAFRRAERDIAVAQGMMAPPVTAAKPQSMTEAQTGFVTDNVVQTANALIGRGVPAAQALAMAQEVAATGVISPAMSSALQKTLDPGSIMPASYGPIPDDRVLSGQMDALLSTTEPSRVSPGEARRGMAETLRGYRAGDASTEPTTEPTTEPSPVSPGESRQGMEETLNAAEAARARQAELRDSYERDGYDPIEAANRAAADANVQAQTGNPNSKAAKDRYGNNIGDGRGGYVTSGELSGDKRADAPSYSDLSGSPHDNTGGSEGCFAKGTLIMMDDGTQKPVEDVDIGDEVKLGGFVFATGKFLINNLYNYKGIEVSGSHMVLEDDEWIRVQDSELATLVNEDDTIVYVFGSENRRIVIDDIVFTDYFEVSEQEKLKQLGDSYFTNWKENAKIVSKSNVEVRNTNDANVPTLAA